MTTRERLLQLAAEHQQKADALRLAATVLNGDQTARKAATHSTALEAAIELRKTQRSTSRSHATAKRNYRRGQSGKLSPYQREQLQRYAKAAKVAGLLKERGPLEISELSAAARAIGIDGLTGIWNYTKAGYIKRTSGKGKKSVYAFVQMPTAPEGLPVTEA